MIRPLLSRWWPSARVFATAALMVSALACGGSSSPGDDDSIAAEPAEPTTDKYKPEVDEGLGASIAIVIDNSGSMEDEANGDSRP